MNLIRFSAPVSRGIFGILTWFLLSPSVGQSQEMDVASLVHPSIAERLSLSDEQRVQIQQELQARATSLATAQSPSEQNTVRKQSRDKILSLLSEEQRTAFQATVAAQDLMFQFNETEWNVVLDWFARQQELTLVMDRTPPGVFTYSDKRPRSPAEGIDLLNGVLMTRGFTLVRREKMLVVMQLSESIPIELLPRVELDKLTERGKFELVSCIFPLGGRPVASVLAEVQPYLNNYARAFPIASGSKLLVVENAGKMATINELIASVPPPVAPPKPKPPVPPPVPVFAAYTIGSLDPNNALETVQKLVPSSQITLDSRTGVLSAYVVPSQQATIKLILDDMQKNASALPASTTEAYLLGGQPADAIVPQLQRLVPKSQVSAAGDRVLVTAGTEELAKVQAALTALGLKPVQAKETVRVFELTGEENSALAPLISQFLPESQAAVSGNSLIVRGSEEDMQVAQQVVELWERQDGAKEASLRGFVLDREADAEWLATVARIVPDAKLWLSENDKKLVVLGDGNEVVAIEAILPQLQTLLPQQQTRRMQVYSLTESQLQRKGLLDSLPADLVDIKVAAGAVEEELFVWASDEQHASFAEFLKSLDVAIPAKPKTLPKSYSITVAEPAALLTLLQASFEEATFQLSEDREKLLVLAEESSQQAIAERIAVIQAEMEKRVEPELKIYQLANLTASELQTALAPTLGDKKTIVAPDQKRLLVWADPATHVELASFVESLSQQPTVVPKLYDITADDPTMLIELLQAAFGDAQLKLNEDSSRLLVLAEEAVQEKIAERLVAIQSQLPQRSKAELKTYSVPGLSGSALQSAIAPLIGEARNSIAPDAKRVLVWADAKTHADLDTLVQSLAEQPGVSEQLVVVTYSLKHVAPSAVQTIMTQILPEATFLASDEMQQLVVTTNLKNQTIAKSTLEQMDQPAAEAERDEIRTLEVQGIDAATLQTSLQAMWPDLSMSVSADDQILASGAAKQLAEVQEALDRLFAQQGNVEKTVRSYKLAYGDMATVPGVLGQLAPKAVLSTDPKTRTITVWGDQQQHARIAEALKQLAESAKQVRTPATYSVKPTQLAAVTLALSSLYPEAAVASDATTGQILVLASQESQDEIRGTIELIAKGSGAESKEVVVIPVDIQRVSLADLLQSLQQTVPPTLTLNSSSEGKAIIAIGTPEEVAVAQEQVKKLIEKLPAPVTASPKVYKLDHVSTPAAQQMLAGLVPTASITPEPAQNALVITADSEAHRKVAEFLKSYDVASEEGKIAKIYPVPASQIPTVTLALGELLPRAIVSSDPTRGRLVILADEKFHKDISQLIEAILEPSETTPIQVAMLPIDIEQVDLNDLLSAMEATLPESLDLKPSSDGKAIIASGSAEQLKRAREQIVALTAELPVPVKLLSRAYPLEHVGTGSAQLMLSGLLPNATVGRDKIANTLVVSASEKDHAQVVEFLKSYDVEPDDGKTTQVYEQKDANVARFSEILAELLPDAEVFGSADLQAVVITANSEDHERASDLMDRFKNNQKGQETRVFHLEKGDVRYVGLSLAELVPEANVVADRGSNSILATGSPEDLARIEKVVEQIEDTENDSKEIRVFPLGTADARYVDAAILALDGVESAVAERETNSLIVVAPKETMATVATVIEEIKAASPKESVTKVFRLENSDARYIDNAILAIEGVIGAIADRDSNSVIVTAPKEVMERVDSVVEQIESDQHKDHETKVFKLTYADPRYIDSAVLAIADNVSAVADRATNSLIVTASKADMARITVVVEQIDKRELTERTTSFYKVDASEPSSLAKALADNFPEATLTADESAGGIFATATMEEHEAIAVVVENLNEQPSRMPTLKTFVLKHAHVPTTADAIESAFGLSSNVGVGFHEESQSVFVVGTAQDLEIAAKLIEQIDQSKSQGEGRTMKTFPVSQVDGNSLVPIIQSLFRDEQPRLEVRYDGFARELYATGTPSQLKRVEETLTQLSGPERELVVMQLRELDTFTFRSAVDALFRDQPARMLPNISMDQAQQIVMIRATPEQHEKIRALAEQMGEEAAEIQGGMPQAKSSRLRFVPMNGTGDRVLTELERLWPDVGENPIRVIRPGATATETEKKEQLKMNPPAKPGGDASSDLHRGAGLPRFVSAPIVQDETSANKPSGQPSARRQESASPIVIVVGEDRWTLASDDFVALDRMERLIQGIMSPRMEAYATRGNYSLYLLHNASAEATKELLSELFGIGKKSDDENPQPFNNVKIVADNRVNGLIVSGSRNDRKVIEEMLGVLDSEDLVRDLELISPTVIQVENTDAGRVVEILGDVYASQLRPNGGRAPFQVPDGVTSAVASIFEQLNAERTGPILTLTVDEATNSIVMRAPQQLTSEIEAFVGNLDQQASSASPKRFDVIQLESSSARSLRDAIELLLAK